MNKKKGIEASLTRSQHSDSIICKVGMDDLKDMSPDTIVKSYLQGPTHKKIDDDEKMAIALDVLVKIDRYYRR